MSFNRLSFAQAERLALLAEELGECQQAIGKILRHGLHSWNPDISGGRDNRDDLEGEIGDILAAVSILVEKGDVRQSHIDNGKLIKLEKVGKYLHHNKLKRYPAKGQP